MPQAILHTVKHLELSFTPKVSAQQKTMTAVTKRTSGSTPKARNSLPGLLSSSSFSGRLHSTAPALETRPAGQEVQVLFDVADVAVEYLPAGQLVHSEAPAVQAHTHRQTDSVVLRYKTRAQLPEHSSEPMHTHIKLYVSRCTYACYVIYVSISY